MTKVPDNEVYINGLDVSTSVSVLIASGAIPVTPVTVGSVNKANAKITATIKDAPELIPAYNKFNHTDYIALPPGSYELSGNEATINVGSNLSNTINLSILSLDSIKRGIVYLLPVTIDQSSGAPVMNAVRTAYYVFRIGVSQTVVSLNKNHFTAPPFSGPAFNSMKAITYQARLYAFELVGPAGIMGTDHGSPPGMELRLGDYGEQNNQFYSAIGSGGGSIAPATLGYNTWYHIAVTYDGAVYKVYLNGVLVKSGAYTGTVNLTGKNFTFGFCYDESYNLNAWLGECRVWSRALTQEEIQENACEVDPGSPGLEAYWKFNEGTGNVAHDVTGHGHDAVAAHPVTWITGQICQ